MKKKIKIIMICVCAFLMGALDIEIILAACKQIACDWFLIGFEVVTLDTMLAAIFYSAYRLFDA